MIPVIFWGATGQAKVLRDALSVSDARLVALFDNREIPSPFPDVPIFHGAEGLAAWETSSRKSADIRACVAIGGARGRERLSTLLWLKGRGYSPLTVVHPRAYVARDARMGDGCQILALATLCASARLGDAVVINTKASVDHDCAIGDGVHVAPGATITGEVVVDEFAFIGAGAVILPGIRIGAEAVVGAGAVVTRDVPAGTTVVGNPARVLEKRGAQISDRDGP